MFLVFKKKIIRWIYFVTFFIRLFINMGVDPLGYSVKFDRLGGGGVSQQLSTCWCIKRKVNYR